MYNNSDPFADIMEAMKRLYRPPIVWYCHDGVPEGQLGVSDSLLPGQKLIAFNPNDHNKIWDSLEGDLPE